MGVKNWINAPELHDSMNTQSAHEQCLSQQLSMTQKCDSFLFTEAVILKSWSRAAPVCIPVLSALILWTLFIAYGPSQVRFPHIKLPAGFLACAGILTLYPVCHTTVISGCSSEGKQSRRRPKQDVQFFKVFDFWFRSVPRLTKSSILEMAPGLCVREGRRLCTAVSTLQ